MDFTREPIIETVITPKEGHKLVIRNSKAVGQEEFFVDAVEVVSFGQALFFRSVEKPKAFLVPTSDYEVLEVREARMVLKHVGLERAIKIGGGKEAAPQRHGREVEKEIPPAPAPVAVSAEAAIAPPVDAPIVEDKGDGRFERKRERRRHYRRRRGREEGGPREGGGWSEQNEGEMVAEEPENHITAEPLANHAPLEPEEQPSPTAAETITASSSILSSLLPPPTTLISDTMARYRENELFKGAFFLKENQAEREVKQETLSDDESSFEEASAEDSFPPVAAEPVYEDMPASQTVYTQPDEGDVAEPYVEPAFESEEEYSPAYQSHDDPAADEETIDPSLLPPPADQEQNEPRFQ